MKSLEKVVIGLVLSFGLLVSLQSVSMATAGVRGGKGKAVINISATATLACTGHCTVYSVWISSAAAADFAVLRDSNTANTTSAPTAYAISTTTGFTQVTFDPPLIFINGVSLNCSATTPFCGVAFEPGDVTSGY